MRSEKNHKDPAVDKKRQFNWTGINSLSKRKCRNAFIFWHVSLNDGLALIEVDFMGSRRGCWSARMASSHQGIAFHVAISLWMVSEFIVLLEFHFRLRPLPNYRLTAHSQTLSNAPALFWSRDTSPWTFKT